MADKDHIFLRVGDDNKLYRAENESEAAFVRVPIEDYVSLEEWNNLVYKYNELAKKPVVKDNMVMITQEELNGYQKAIRIVRDRAKQQIDKARADNYGYTLLRADFRRYNYDSKDKLWLITKSTPYSAKIGLQEITPILKKDLIEYYSFCEGYFFKPDSYGSGQQRVKLTGNEWALATRQFNDVNFKERDFVLDNSSFGRDIKKFLSLKNGVVSFEISKISVNYAMGVYEVSYWATGMI